MFVVAVTKVVLVVDMLTLRAAKSTDAVIDAECMPGIPDVSR